ncbi:MAG: NADH-quinone oxidoreductase subunit C [Candidatus Thermoplasmatota archaeon]
MNAILTAEEILTSYKTQFQKGLEETRLETFTTGIKKTEIRHLWIRITKEIFKDCIRHLFTFTPEPHFAVASGYDLGETIELVYHFSLFQGHREQEISINFIVPLQKSDPSLETITDLFPGALISEQEKQEMLGVTIIGIPVNTRVFISDDFPKDVYPWRRDETGPQRHIRNLHEVKKP